MKVILFETIDTLGRAGEIVEVKKGHYRNYLAPQGKADVATESTLKRLTAKRAKLEEQAQSELGAAQKRGDNMKETKVLFAMRSDDKGQLYGSVGVADIQRKLAEQKIEIPRRDILIGHPIKTVGDHEVGLRLHPDVIVPAVVSVEKVEH